MAAEVTDTIMAILLPVVMVPILGYAAWHDFKREEDWRKPFVRPKLRRPDGLECAALAVGLAVTGGTLWVTR